jgi:hypothetical protein
VQIIAGANFSTTAQCGEGDHGVVEWGDALLLYFLCWDGPNGALTVSIARSALSDGGRPGTWFKWLDGAFASPGVGGNSDMLHGIVGTAVTTVPALPLGPGGLPALLAVGVVFSDAPLLAWSADGFNWTAAHAPLFYAAPSTWNREPDSPELFA